MITSYCNFTIFLASLALNVCGMFIVVTTPFATISLLLLFSNPPSQTLKHIYPKKLASNENFSTP